MMKRIKQFMENKSQKYLIIMITLILLGLILLGGVIFGFHYFITHPARQTNKLYVKRTYLSIIFS
ncbi:MAG: hypothetical protein NOI47_000344 [Candidatus Phytoplasma pruni]|nr:hypothetical protein [Candidatus Phytoplasma pruni]